MQSLFEIPQVYRALQKPFVWQKLQFLLAKNSTWQGSSVLDIGCGPAVNISYFKDAKYTGLDLTPSYVGYGNLHHPGKFLKGNAATASSHVHGKFDVVLVNSLMHHLDDTELRSMMQEIIKLLAPGGTVYVIDLCTDYSSAITRFLAIHDQGRHPRSREQLRQACEEWFTVKHVSAFQLKLLGMAFWDMVYLELKGSDGS